MPPFLFGAFTIVFLFLFQFLTNHLNRFLGKDLSYWIIIQLLGYNLSWMVVLAIPIGLLFGTLMAFGKLSSTFEITIMKSGGMSLIRMMIPVIIVGLLLSVFVFWFNDEVLPDTNHRAKLLLNDVTRKKPTFSIESGQYSTELEGYTILARTLDSASGVLTGVTIYDNSRGRRMNIASADSATISFSSDMSNLIFFLKHGEMHQLMTNDGRDYRKIDFEKYQIVVATTGFAFERTGEGIISRGDRELKIKDMRVIVNEARSLSDSAALRVNQKLKEHYGFIMAADLNNEDTISSSQNLKLVWSDGLREVEKRLNFLKATVSSDINQKNDFLLRANQYMVEIYKKYSIPFACFLFVIVGCPLGIITRKGNFGTSAGISLVFYLFYWVCLIGGEKLADRGFLSPFLSMWIGNIIMFVVGLYVMLIVSNEGFSLRKLNLFAKNQKIKTS